MTPETLLQHVQRVLGVDMVEAHIERGEASIRTVRARIADVLKALRDDPDLSFVQLMDITAVDYPARVERFDVVYQLLSLRANSRLRITVETDEATPVPTVAAVYPTAGWFERECWDLFGVSFSGHPDLRRIMNDYDFDGHPLRKDFPLTGFVEVRYDDEEKRIVYEPVKLMQDYRHFDFSSPWEGMVDVNFRLPPDPAPEATAPTEPAKV